MQILMEVFVEMFEVFVEVFVFKVLKCLLKEEIFRGVVLKITI